MNNYLNLNMDLGLNIKKRRKYLNITQEQLAEAVDLSQSYLGQIERGVRGVNVENLIRIANYLEISLDCLLADYLKEYDYIDDLDKQWNDIFDGKSKNAKKTYISMVRDLEKYIDVK